jgi:hypothetical protein
MATVRIRASLFSRRGVRKLLTLLCKEQPLVFWTEDWDLCWSIFTVSGPPIEVRRIVNFIAEWTDNT